MAKSKSQSSKKTKKKSTSKKTTPKSLNTKKNTTKSPSTTVKKTITKSGSNKKKTIKKEVVSTKTMEIKVPNLPKKKETPKKEVEGVKTKETPKSLKEKLKDILVVKKKPKRKSNSKKIKKAKKQNFGKEFKKMVRKIKMYGITSVIPVKSLVTIGIMIVIIIWGVGLLLGFLTGGSKIELDNIPYDIDQLKTISYNVEDSDNIVSSSKAYDSLKDYYVFDFEKEFKLEEDLVEDFSIKLNIDKKQVYIAVKPTKNHNEEVKSVFEVYLKEKNITKYDYLDYSGYEFFIASNNNKMVTSKIRQSQVRVFDALRELKSEDILEELGIKSSLYDEALVKKAIIVDKNTGYYIFKATSRRHAKEINKIMEKYFENKEKELKYTNEEEYELIKNRYSKVKGNVCVYIVSYDNELVLDLLQI